MDSLASVQHEEPATRPWRGIIWRLGVACLLGSLALLPYDLGFFIPGIGAFLGSFDVFDTVGGSNALVFPVLLAEAALALIMLLSFLVDRHISRRWFYQGGASLLLLTILLALDGFLLAQAFVDIAFFFAGFRIGISISFDFYPFFFAAIAASFVLGPQALYTGKKQIAGVFVLLGVVAVAGGALLDELISLIAPGQEEGLTTFLVNPFFILAPLLLLMGVFGGLFGGYLRIMFTRLFSSVPQQRERSGDENEQASRQVALPLFLWGIVWRWAVAGAVGDLAGRGVFHIVALFFVNRPISPQITISPITDLLLVLLPLALLLLGMLAQRQPWRNRSIGWDTGISLLFFLLIIGLEDALEVIFYDIDFHIGFFSSVAFLLLLVQKLANATALAMVTAFALGSMNQIGRKTTLRRLLLASMGIAAFLGALPGVLQYLEKVNNNFSLYFPSIDLRMTYLVGGFLLAAVGGLLGGWLQLEAKVWVARLAQSNRTLSQ